MKITKRTSKHLKLARQLIALKIMQWTGREPFPGDPLGTYKKMKGDIDLELHNVEFYPHGEKKISDSAKAILIEYKSLLADIIGFHTEFGNSGDVEDYTMALQDVDNLLTSYEVVPSQLNVKVTKRPQGQCNEKGLCQIKVVHDAQRTDVPQIVDGQWGFGSEKTFKQDRECLNCGRQWTNSIRDGVVGPAVETKKSSLVSL